MIFQFSFQAAPFQCMDGVQESPARHQRCPLDFIQAAVLKSLLGERQVGKSLTLAITFCHEILLSAQFFQQCHTALQHVLPCSLEVPGIPRVGYVAGTAGMVHQQRHFMLRVAAHKPRHMLCVDFLEEVIFRGLLFTAIATAHRADCLPCLRQGRAVRIPLGPKASV